MFHKSNIDFEEMCIRFIECITLFATLWQGMLTETKSKFLCEAELGRASYFRTFKLEWVTSGKQMPSISREDWKRRLQTGPLRKTPTAFQSCPSLSDVMRPLMVCATIKALLPLKTQEDWGCVPESWPFFHCCIKTVPHTRKLGDGSGTLIQPNLTFLQLCQ